MRKTWFWTGLVLAMIAGGSYVLYVLLQSPELPDHVLYGNGHIEGTEIEVAAEVAGRVVESTLAEGETVIEGELLVRLDDAELQLRKKAAQAEVEALVAERERVQRELEVARHHFGTAKKEFARSRELRESGTASAQRLEQAENAHEEARGAVARLEATVTATEARIVAAESQLDIIENNLRKTTIAAPLSGTVLTRAIEPGEYARPGQTIAVLVDLAQVELKIFVPEANIGKFKLGDPARVRVDAFPEQTFESRVARVDQRAQFTPRDIHMPQERVRMVFGVTLALENPDGVMKPGMPADAWVLWQNGSTWPERLFVPQ